MAGIMHPGGSYFKTGTTSSHYRHLAVHFLRGHTNDVSRGRLTTAATLASPLPRQSSYTDLAARPVSAASRESARDARRGRWNRRQALHGDRLPATRACAVGSVLDALQRLTNLMKFGEAHLVELRQDFFILQFARALLPVAVVR
jgi:hypothetical protein